MASLALLAGRTDEVDRVIATAMQEMTGKAIKISEEYCRDDLAFVVTAMRVAVDALEMLLKEDEKKVASVLHEHTHSTVINLSELKNRQRR